MTKIGVIAVYQRNVMDKLRVIFGLVIFALLQINQQHNVRCIDAAAKLESIHQRLAQLGQGFNEKIRRVFYDYQQVAGNPPLHTMSAYIAELEAIVYVYQRSALFVAEGIIRNYFIDKSIPLEENLEESDTLIDLTVNLLLKRSADNTVRGIEKQRKFIHLLSKTYQDVPGVVDLAKIYLEEINDIVNRQESSAREFKESLERYRDEGWLFSQAPSTERTVLVALDKIVIRSMDCLNADQLLERYADPKLLLDIRLAKINMPPDIDAILRQPVTIKEVLDYESRRQEQIEETMGIEGYLRSIDRRLSNLRVQFGLSMSEVFYQQQAIPEKERNVPLLCLAVQAAEIESLVYALERNMLLVIKDMIEQQYDGINRILEITNVPIDIIKYRLLEYATQLALEKHIERRKIIYLMFRKYDHVEAVPELACRYFALISRHKAEVYEGQKSLVALNREISECLPESMVPELIKYIDGMVEAAIHNWSRRSVAIDEAELLKQHTDPILYESLRMAKQKTSSAIEFLGQDLIDAVSMDAVETYEITRESICQDTSAIGRYFKEIDAELDKADEQFLSDVQTLFYERKQEKSTYDLEDFPLMALSAQILELVALLHAGERRMLMIIKATFRQNGFNLNHLLMINKIPVEIAIQTLTEYALENSIRRVEHRRRKIYYLLHKYDYIDRMKILGRRYVQRLHAEEKKLTHVRGLIDMYKTEVVNVLPEEVLVTLMDSVNNLVDEASIKWSVIVSEKSLLGSAGIPADILAQIQEVKRRSYNKILRPNAKAIDAIDFMTIRLYEERLLAMTDRQGDQ